MEGIINQMNYNNRSIYVRDKKPQTFTEALISPRTIILRDNGQVLDHGIINLATGTYAILYCEDICNISIITNGSDSKVLTLFISDKDEFASTVDAIKAEAIGLTISPQNNKLNSYAVSVSEKLQSGIEIRIFDAQDDDDKVECPSCGVLNDWDPNLPYCMECGATLSHK